MIMKRILYIMPFILLAAASCKEDQLDVYNGADYVHFTPSINDIAEATYNFATDGVTTREESVEIPVEIRLWGYLPVEDFICNYSVDKQKTTAQPSDYVEPSTSVFRAQQPVDTLWVTVNRKEQLLATDYRVVVNLDSAGEKHIAQPVKYLSVTIHVQDKIDHEPIWWGTTQDLGKYSPIKYRLFNLYLGKMLRDLNEYTNITFKQEALAFKAWLKENWDNGTYKYYAEDGKTPLHDTIPE